MPTLPARPSLEHLKKQAKRLHKAALAHDAEALARVGPYFGDPSRISLQQSQLVIARDYGFSSWAKLKRYVEAGQPDDAKTEQRATYFLDLVCLHYGPDVERSSANFHEAAEILATYPEIERQSIHAAAAIGTVDTVQEMLRNDPDALDQKGGPFQWTPLMYAAYARLPGASSFATGQALLDAGADPNAHYMWGGTYRFSVLTGIFGDGERGKARLPEHPDMVAFARAVLDKGAHPNDSQGAYNRCFSPDNTHLELMLEYGLKDADPSDWWLCNPDHRPEDHRTMHFQFIMALRKGFAERAHLLIDHGVDLNKTDAHYYQSPPVEFTPYQVALLHGLPDVARRIKDKGGNSTPLSGPEQFQAACMAGDLSTAQKLAARHKGRAPEKEASMLLDAADSGNLEALRVMIDLRFELNPTDARTPLHAAAWRDRAEAIDLLLAAGADPKRRDPDHLSPPLGHAFYAQSQRAIDLLGNAEMDIFFAAAIGHVAQIKARLSEDAAWLNATVSSVLPEPACNRADPWKTPLWFAGVNGQTEAVRYLLTQGARSHLKDSAGQTVADHAAENGHHEVADLLRDVTA